MAATALWVGRLDPRSDPQAAAALVRDRLAEQLGVRSVEVEVALYGGAYPKTRQQRHNQHRGFAVVAGLSQEEAAAAAGALDGWEPPGAKRALQASTRVDTRYDAGGTDSRPDAEPHPAAVRRAEAAAAERRQREAEAERALRAEQLSREFESDCPEWAAEVDGLAAVLADPFNHCSDLAGWPRRETSLDPSTMLPALPAAPRARVWRLLRDSAPQGRALYRALARLARVAPADGGGVRVKELVETVEAARVASSYFSTAGEAARVYDLACGHGWLGILMGLQQPSADVVCVDLQRRPCFDALLRALEQEGCPLPRVSFVEADIAAVLPLPPGSAVVAVHACNETNQQVLDMAEAAEAMWCVVPCCVRGGVALPGCVVSRLPDAARHAMLCGSVAEKRRARLVRALPAGISNRDIVIAGGGAKAAQSCDLLTFSGLDA
eukprot:TRINITY_DN1951_c1_g1_i1.p1 TRINITY_DN1951_c1_g1~~TRINITY_DN1951_c1_g1_i1.p1  ORF type:complete len:438 (+),score=144.05 TRINITY_DN1951_c1_g1_i1:60-1373(+)